MKKTIVFIFIFVITLCFLSGYGLIEKKIINQKKSYTIGDIIEYRIKIKTGSEKLKIYDSRINDIEIIKKYNKCEKNILTIYRKYQLFNLSIKKLPDITLENDKGEKQIVKGLKINMKSLLSEKNQKIEDIVPPMKGLNTGYSPIPLIITLILMIVLSIIIYFLYKKIKNRKKKIEISENIWEKEIDPLEYIETEWGKISIDDFLKKGKEKELFYTLSEILKTFLSLYYKKNYMDMTSYELIREFKKEKNSELLNDTEEFLMQADLIKFAKKIPEKEKEINYTIYFFNKLIEYYKRVRAQEESKLDIDHNN